MQPLTSGVILISDPFLKDPNFVRTVVFMCDHQPDGSFGFVLNRRYKQTLNQLLPELEDFPIIVNYGGPVQTDTLHFIHSQPEIIPDGKQRGRIAPVKKETRRRSASDNRSGKDH
ncbi:MAG: YqgE/AlgH family protein [Pedobacter sp.]|nr:MAG: YqgE/AlgH family protein [Pedobacter sp.]